VKTAVSVHDLVETLKFKDGKVDMVLMDVNMPDGLDLEQVIPLVREHINEATQIVGTTIKWSAELRERCIKSGMAELLVKPFNQNDIECALSSFLSCPVDSEGNPYIKPADGSVVPITVADNVPDVETKKAKKEINVLCAEDNPTSLKFAYHILSLLGCKVHCATCGEQAVWMMRQIEFDIIYMDLHMPGMNGYEATKWIRNEMPVHKKPAVLAITGDTSSGVTRRCITAGMEGAIHTCTTILSHTSLTLTLTPPYRLHYKASIQG